jgi:hypothetical protein
MFLTRRYRRSFSQQLAMLLESGVPLHTALELVALQQKSHRWKAVVTDLAKRLTEGERLSGALRGHPRAFGADYVETIRWAEWQGGNLHLVLALRLLAGDLTPVRLEAEATALEAGDDQDLFTRAAGRPLSYSRRYKE